MTDGFKRGAAIAVIGIAGLLGLAAVGPGSRTEAAPIPTAITASQQPQATALAATSTGKTEASPKQQTATDKELRREIVDMLQKRMGLSAKQADKQADAMVQHMRDVHGDQAGQAAEACGDSTGPNGSTSSNMMGSSAGSMMGGSAESMMGNDSL